MTPETSDTLLKLSPEMTLALVCGAAFLSGVVNSATGVGGAGVFQALTLAILPPSQALVVVAVSQLSRNLVLALILRAEARWEVVWRLALAGVLGAFLGALFVGQLDEVRLKQAIGIALLVFVTFEVLGKDRDWHMPLTLLPPVGFFTGFSSALTGSTGPIAAPFLLRHGLIGPPFVATVTWAGLAMNATKLTTYGAQGWFHSIPAPFVYGTAIGVVLGVALGVRVLRGLSPGRFRAIFLTILTLVALGMVLGRDHNPAADEARLQREMREWHQAQHE